MSAAEQTLKFIFEMNIILALAFVLFRSTQTLLRLSTKNHGARHLKNLSLFLLVFSLVIPGLLAVLPAPAPNVSHFSTNQPLSEGSSRGRASNIKSHLTPASSTLFSESHSGNLLRLRYHRNAAKILAVLIFLCAVLMVRFLSQLVVLGNLIGKSAGFKSLGKIRIVVSDEISIPFSARLFRSWVVLPVYILDKKEDLRVAIRHEIQHHRQLDTVWILFVEILGVIYFANPFFYLWKKSLTELQELTCDEALIGRKGISSRDYCSCLIRVAEAAIRSRSVYAGTACMASVTKDPKYIQSFLKRRIKMLTQKRLPPGYGKLVAVVGTVVSLLVALFAFGSQQFLTLKDAPENPGQASYDPVVQQIAEDVLSQELVKHQAKSGFAIVTEPSTGRILAVADLRLDGTKPVHGALGRRLEIASVAKPLIGSEAIEKGVTTPDESHNCENGSYKFGGNMYHDWKAFASLTTTGTIAQSSNICGIKVGEELGSEGIATAYQILGFGAGGSADTFPGARTGLIPAPSDMATPDYIATMATGYTIWSSNFLVTPLEVTQAYGAMANGGTLLKPVQASEAGGIAVRQAMSEETSAKMRAILTKVVTEGTGKHRAESSLYTTAGKTGTAYDPDSAGHSLLGGRHGIGSFIGFAPANNPRVLVYATMSDPGDGEPNGSRLTAPVFKNIAERVLQYWNVAPDKH